MKGEILKLSQDGEYNKSPISAAIRKRRSSLKVKGRFAPKRNEERRASKEMKMTTPLSPLGRNTIKARRVPAPAPRRSEKYILVTRCEALEIAKDIVSPAKKKGTLRRK